MSLATRLSRATLWRKKQVSHGWRVRPLWAHYSVIDHAQKRTEVCRCFQQSELSQRSNFGNSVASWLGTQSPMMYATVPSLCLVLPSVVSSAIPAVLLPGSLADCSFRWVMESLAHVGPITMGLPGLVSLTIFVNPMLEAIADIVKRGDVGKLPLLPYSAMAAQGMVWTVYGLLVGNPAIWSPNFCALLLGLSYCGVYIRHCPPTADWLPYSRGYHVAGVLATGLMCYGMSELLPTSTAVTSLGFLGNTMTMIMFAGPLAATRTVIREQSTQSLPFGFTCAVFVNCTLWFFYAYFMIDDPFIYVQDGIGLLLTTAQLALFARYGIYQLPFPRRVWGLVFKEVGKGK